MTKLIATDLDGTLINDSGFISNEDLRTINRILESGNIFSVISGRSWIESKYLVEKIHYPFHFLGGNGSEIWFDGRVLEKKYIEQTIAMRVIKQIDKNNMFYKIYRDNITEDKKTFILKKGYLSVQLALMEKEPLLDLLKTSKVVYKNIYSKNIHKLEISECSNINKILILDHRTNKLKLMKKQIEDNYSDVRVSSSYKNNIEITKFDIDKGKALNYLIKKYQMDKSDVIVIGDNENDLPMFLKGTNTVAVENSILELKEKANLITVSNNNSPLTNIMTEMQIL